MPSRSVAVKWFALVALLTVPQIAQDPPRGDRREDRRPAQPPEASVFLTDVPEHSGSVVLGRPTATSISVSLLSHVSAEPILVWGTDPNRLPTEGRRITLAAEEPKVLVLDGLKPDTAYAFAVLDAATKRRLLPAERVGTFHTARARGKSFTFTIQADSHLDGSCSTELYRRMLANAVADGPDFHIDLGDTFMTEKHASRASAAGQYASQRYHLGLIAQSAPLFMALGNHDGETLDRSGRTSPDGLAVWSHQMRTRYFMNPIPGGFYTGNAERDPLKAWLEDYYAWEWGDALFVVLDPYWTSLPTKGGRSPWNMTIGKSQYDWMARTLRGSKATFKFVFIHQLTGSYHPAGRGGTEASVFQEWGGRDLDGTDAFAVNRPGWEMPIHQLLVQTDVTAVFHGHDHFYAKQERDGITYQLVPQPAHRNDRSHHADEYGYKEGQFLPSSGHLRVKVTPHLTSVEYVRAALPEQERRGAPNGSINASYTLDPRGRAQANGSVASGRPMP